MQSQEYEKMSDVEQQHWFYKGKRAIVAESIHLYFLESRSPVVLDVGAGTGLLVKELRKKYNAYGVEPSTEALKFAVLRNQHDYLVGGSILSLPLADQSVDVSMALDVLEHIEDDRAAFAEMLRVTRKGGLLIVSVPAYSFAMSDWDVALGHYRRYDSVDIQRLLKEFPVKILDDRYINNLLCGPIIAYRLLRKNFKSSSKNRLEDMVPSPWLNQILHWSFVKPATTKWLKIPFGLSRLLVLRNV